MTCTFRIFTTLITALGWAGVLAAADIDQTIDQIFGAKKEFELKRFGPARWMDDGASYTTLEPSPESKELKDLVRYGAETGEREVLVTAARLAPPGPQAKPFSIEDYAWSKDGRLLLIFTNAQKVWREKTRGDYWVLDRQGGTLRQLGGKAPAATLMFAKFSPDGTRVAYVREHNLYVETLRTGSIKQLTVDGSPTVINGTADWVNEEELRIRDGFRWSDDSRSLAYWQFDTTGVGEFTLINTTQELYPTLTRYPYPKVGTLNSAVRIGVVGASGGKPAG